MLIEEAKFLRWGFGRVLENRTRGVLAEYIVAKGLGALSKHRIEWDSADIKYAGLAVEVKSAAYLQSWEQKKPSTISFDIGMRRWKWNPDTNEMIELEQPDRVADVYIFALFDTKEKAQANPLDTKQWSFFVMRSVDIDRIFGFQKRVALSRIREFAETCSFERLKDTVDKIMGLSPEGQ